MVLNFLYCVIWHESVPHLYSARAGIESTLSQAVRAFDLRRSLYIGLAKTHLQQILIAVAINLVRVGKWLTDPRSGEQRVSLLASLATHA